METTNTRLPDNAEHGAQDYGESATAVEKAVAAQSPAQYTDEYDNYCPWEL